MKKKLNTYEVRYVTNEGNIAWTEIEAIDESEAESKAGLEIYDFYKFVDATLVF